MSNLSNIFCGIAQLLVDINYLWYDSITIKWQGLPSILDVSTTSWRWSNRVQSWLQSQSVFCQMFIIIDQETKEIILLNSELC